MSPLHWSALACDWLCLGECDGVLGPRAVLRRPACFCSLLELCFCHENQLRPVWWKTRFHTEQKQVVPAEANRRQASSQTQASWSQMHEWTLLRWAKCHHVHECHPATHGFMIRSKWGLSTPLDWGWFVTQLYVPKDNWYSTQQSLKNIPSLFFKDAVFSA